MGRIEEEAARMGVLVEDLLPLARLDTVAGAAHGPVDLARLARDAVDDARATAPARRIELRADGPVTVAGEEDQLRQVLANLLRSALVHTPAGTPVEVGVRGNGAGARLEVRDHGSGLHPATPRRCSGASGAPRAAASAARTGLGFAIVAAIVDAHDGSVEARGGAAFTVRLPGRVPLA